MRVNSRRLLLIGGGGVGGGNPDFDLGPPLRELLGRPIIGLRGHDNFLCRKGTCGGDVGLVGEELGEGLPEVLLVLDELLDCSFPIHFRLVRGGVGAGVLETREPKSVMAGVWWRGRWDVIRDGSDERELEVEVVEDPVVDGSKVLKFELGIPGTEPFKERDFVIVEERPLKNVSNPLMLLCVCWQVVDVARNGGLL